LRPERSVVQLRGRHRSSSRRCRVVVSTWRLRASKKARVAGAARALGSREIVEDQDVTATSATRPKSRVATRASVQQHSVASCIVTGGVCARCFRACQGPSRVRPLQVGRLVARCPPVRCLAFLPIVLLVAVLACGESPKKPASTAARPRTSPRSVRITIDALHQLGGVPSGWQLTPLPGDVEAGRRLFQEVGCSSCHKVAGEPSGGSTRGQSGPGPELTGMGSHHPPAYFLEAILNPDAVLVDGPGY